MQINQLIEKIIEKGNPSVMGLDPKLDLIPDFIKEGAVKEYGRTPKAAEESIFRFNKGLIDACGEYIPAIKPQSAYYEMYGEAGMRALSRTIEYAKKHGICVILDVKRNDIGPSAEAYAAAFFGNADLFGEPFRAFSADAVTINPYLGTDGVAPFLSYPDAFVFVLVKTSNRSGGELQDMLTSDGKPYYFAVAEMVKRWGGPAGEYGYNAAGAVVGATYPAQLAALREYMPETFFLIPGYGAQGGTAKDILPAFDKNALGAIVNSSRGIIYAYREKKDPVNYMLYARNAVLRMRDEFSDIKNEIKGI